MERFKPFKKKAETPFETKAIRKNKELKGIEGLKEKCQKFDLSSEINTFEDMPLSERTLKGLEEAGYTVPTKIQKESIIIALKGMDLLGAAKTGSGKTLAFIIPVLENLYCKLWSKFDGVGAIIMTPTRELALQIYKTLVSVGKHHDFSAGLIIGGKDVGFERKRMHLVNIIICTPGRLLQHMDENPLFDCTNLQVLVLDEADRCLDMGFEKEMNAIIENIPTQRLTLLFSATQTKKVKDLARLSLTDPKYISVHEHEKFKTPEGLMQSYTICEQHDKIPVLWSFIKSHPKHKIIIFFATCNQVKFVFDAMCHLRPYNTLFSLTGKLKQHKRMDVYESFCRKQHAVLFATDLASRGLDFPEVHWVIHADCPEDVETYIHRSGRTARYHKGGESLLLLNPSEKSFIDQLESNKIPINEIKVNPLQIMSPQAKLEAFLAKLPELKASAQRAFVAYAKSVYLMKDKSVFDIRKIDTHKFARSMGLVVSPRIRFIEKAEKAKLEKDGKNIQNIENEKIENTVEPKGTDFNFFPEASDSEDDILTMKRKDHEIEEEEDGKEIVAEPNQLDTESKKKPVITKAKIAKRMLKKKILPNKKTLFTEEGEALINQTKEKVTDAGKMYEASSEGGLNIEEAKKVLLEEDKWDRKLFKEKLKAKRRATKLKLLEKVGEQKEEKVEQEVNEESEDESDSGPEPDLSWLPDPDEVYNKDQGDDSDEPEQSIPRQKRKHSRSASSGEENTRESENSESEDEDKSHRSKKFMTIAEQEELALKFLKSKNK